VLSEGVNPFLSDLDCYAMAGAVVDEALRRQLCAGASLERIAALDNFCWPDPVRSAQTPDGEYKLAQLVRACRGLYDACRAYGIPLISGKDSMKNDAVMGGVKISVPPTLLVSAIGQIDDVRRAVTLDFKQAGEIIFVLGETGAHTGGSEYFRYLGERAGMTAEDGGPAPYVGNSAPTLDTERQFELYRLFAQATARGWIRSAAAPARGGLGVAIARAAIAGRLGAVIELGQVPVADETIATDDLLFAESSGRFVVTVTAADTAAFERQFAGHPCRRVGAVSDEQRLTLSRDGTPVAEVEITELLASFKGTLTHA